MNNRKLIHYESKRIRSSKIFLVVELGIILMLLLGLAFQLYLDRSSGYTVYEGYRIWTGQAGYGDDIQYFYEEDLKKYLEEIEGYDSYLQKIQEDAGRSSINALFHKDSTYDQENRQRTKKAYEKLEGIALSPEYLPGISRWVGSLWQNLLLLTAAVAIGVKAFTGQGAETRRFLRTIPNGGNPLSSIQLLASMRELTGLCLLSFGLSLLLSLTVTPANALLSPVQSIPGYLTCSMHITVWQFLLLWMTMKWAGLLSVLFLVYLLCSVLWAYMDALFAALIFLLVQYEIYNDISPNDYHAIWHYFNFYNLIAPEKLLHTYKNINVLGSCMNTILIWIFMTLSSCLISYAVGRIFYKNYIPRAAERKISRYIRQYRARMAQKHHSAFYYHGKLLFDISRGLFALMLMIILVLYTSYKERDFIDLNEYYYNYYAVSLEKAEYQAMGPMIEIYEKEIQKKLEKTASDPSSDEVLFISEIQNQALEKIRGEYEQIGILREEDKECTYLNQIPWRKILGSGFGQNRTGFFALLLLLVLLPMTAWCIYEQKSHIPRVLAYLPGAKKIRVNKLLVRCFYGFIVWGLLLARDIIPVAGKYQIYGWTHSCRCLLFLPEWTKGIPVYAYFVMVQTVKLLLILIIINIPERIQFDCMISIRPYYNTGGGGVSSIGEEEPDE